MTTSSATSASSQAIDTTIPPIAKLSIRQYDRTHHRNQEAQTLASPNASLVVASIFDAI